MCACIGSRAALESAGVDREPREALREVVVQFARKVAALVFVRGEQSPAEASRLLFGIAAPRTLEQQRGNRGLPAARRSPPRQRSTAGAASHSDGGRKRTSEPGGSRFSGMPHRCSSRQSNVGALFVARSCFQQAPVRFQHAGPPVPAVILATSRASR